MTLTDSLWARMKASDNFAARTLVNALRTGVRVTRAWKHNAKQFVTNPRYRSTLRMRITSPPDMHQVSGRTRLNRYPEVFTASQAHLGASAGVRILSFGCSTGEEVLSLREYFPKATIVGCEINPKSLKIARGLPVDDRIEFIKSESSGIAKRAPYDAIFCMAVLQRDPQKVVRDGVTHIGNVYPFEKFEEQIDEFEKWLKPGGLLVVHHAHYRMSDTKASKRFTALVSNPPVIDRHAKFDRHGELIAVDAELPSMFVKAG